MRQCLDSDKTKIKKIVCNCCGQELTIKNGIVQEGVFEGKVQWGYFSEWDGEDHSFDLCTECYRKITGGFNIPVTVEERTELL